MKGQPKFIMLGAAGYIAPRHLEAINNLGGTLAAALDPNDSVGILDKFFPNSDFFTEFERFDRHVNKVVRKGLHIDYASICTPNYLHDAHIRFALRNGISAICEKPLVINDRNVEPLLDLERESGKKVNTILQLRLHPSVVKLKKQIEGSNKQSKFDLDLTYITARGKWYDYSWKGSEAKSGGVVTNIGIHFFDMLGFAFGKFQRSTVHCYESRRAAGITEYENARVRWFLSINQEDLPREVRDKGQKTFRSVLIDNQELEFSSGFEDLHQESYKNIIAGKGFSMEDARESIHIVSELRNLEISPLKGDYHTLLKK